jgi:hypothetical protein
MLQKTMRILLGFRFLFIFEKWRLYNVLQYSKKYINMNERIFSIMRREKGKKYTRSHKCCFTLYYFEKQRKKSIAMGLNGTLYPL